MGPCRGAGLPSAGSVVARPAAVAVLYAFLVGVMRRWPEALPLLAVGALPFRVPVAADGRTVNLLIPLYLVIAAGSVTQLVPRLLERRRAGAATVTAAVPGAASPDGVATSRPAALEVAWLQWLLLGAVGLYALQISYSADRVKAAENLAFFYVPFGLLFVLLPDLRWTPRLSLGRARFGVRRRGPRTAARRPAPAPPGKRSLRAERQARLRGKRHERAHGADRRGAGAVREPPARGLGVGVLRPGVQTPQGRKPGDRAERDLRLPHDSRDDRRRAGAARAVRLCVATHCRVPRAVQGGRALHAVYRVRGCLRGAGDALVDIRLLPGLLFHLVAPS